MSLASFPTGRGHRWYAWTTAGRPNRPEQALAERYNLHGFEPTDEADMVAPARRYLAQTMAEGAKKVVEAVKGAAR